MQAHKRVGIIGGGIMELALAQRLTARGLRVTVFERERQLEGLSPYEDYGSFRKPLLWQNSASSTSVYRPSLSGPISSAWFSAYNSAAQRMGLG
jgi:glycine/D-amino acid oxidase-like deaminating enzyme